MSCRGNATVTAANLLFSGSKYRELRYGEKDTSNVNEAPHRRTLFIPTNSSAASVIQQLDNNGGVGLIFDTECDTLSAILKSEYGDYSTIIRKSYHHEAIDLSRRKDDEYRVIERPMLAICLSGTPGQLYTLTPQAEDGTFSRITCYHMPFKAEFRDVLVESIISRSSYSPSSSGITAVSRALQTSVICSSEPITCNLSAGKILSAP